ncbi:hypothetical protein [Frankia sp. CiP3]|uniref:hypothetical protein n=1 Tax=Frankia sp. CiP3 TaxID=2880971 RepID=UPI001EF5228C|nr:hypothetical protein [Frankia sp. CiP3]
MARVLSKGGSAPLPLGSARIEVRLPSAHYHAAVILVTAAGIVHSLKDLTSNDGRRSNEGWLSACKDLVGQFQAQVKARHAVPEAMQTLVEENTALRDQMASTKEALAAERSRTKALLRAVAELSLELEQTREQLAGTHQVIRLPAPRR